MSHLSLTQLKPNAEVKWPKEGNVYDGTKITLTEELLSGTTFRIPLAKTTGHQLNTDLNSSEVCPLEIHHLSPIMSKTPCGQPKRRNVGRCADPMMELFTYKHRVQIEGEN